MYGKHFESMYTGSMVGMGAVSFAVWGYVISHQKPPLFDVELNPVILATIIGEAEEKIVTAINRFCEPDPKSRSKEADGRKLLKQGEYLYHVVNGAEYDAIRNNEERKAYWRDQKRKERSNGKPTEAAVPTSVGDTAKSVHDAWNALQTMPKSLVISDKRRRGLSLRLTDPFFAGNWRPAMAKVAQSKFCNGENDRGWKASFDWFIQPDSVAKIMEGKYDNRSKSGAGSKPNPRNVGTIVGTTNYATAKTKYDREREAKAQGVVGQVAGAAAAQPTP